MSLGPFNAACDGDNVSLTVVFVNSSPGYGYVAGRKDNLVLKQALSGSGARYEAQYQKGQARLWNKGNTAQIALPGGKDMSCKMSPVANYNLISNHHGPAMPAHDFAMPKSAFMASKQYPQRGWRSMTERRPESSRGTCRPWHRP